MSDFCLYGEPFLGTAFASRPEFNGGFSAPPKQDVVNKSGRRNQNVATK
jgi:hypothetical protein